MKSKLDYNTAALKVEWNIIFPHSEQLESSSLKVYIALVFYLDNSDLNVFYMNS